MTYVQSFDGSGVLSGPSYMKVYKKHVTIIKISMDVYLIDSLREKIAWTGAGSWSLTPEPIPISPNVSIYLIKVLRSVGRNKQTNKNSQH